jgi:AcrR family transcriptional regulator
MKTKCENRRQAILDIAATLFREVGFEGASMSEISARVGGSKATLYNYFKSKEELFVEVMMNAAEQAKKGVVWCEYKKGNIVETLHELGQMYMKLVMLPEMLAIRRMLIAEGERSNIGKIYYERGPKKGWQKIATLLEEARDNRELDVDDTWVAAMHLRGLLEAGLYEMRLYGAITKASPKLMKETAKNAVDTFLRAYAIRK